MILCHAGTSLVAHMTNHMGIALAAMVLNIPLLWLTMAVKHLDDALSDVVGSMSEVAMKVRCDWLTLLPLLP